jgi:hypothetical protein
MISINDTHVTPKAPLTYRIRDEAKNAAIAVLGPLAIHEFDFVTFQLDDGRWDWNVPVEERPLSAAVIKANGGKKFLAARAQSMASTPMAHVEAAKPVKLPVPPRRTPVQASGKPAGAPDGGASGEQPPSDEKPPSRSHLTEDGAFLVNAPSDDLRSQEAMLNDLNPACNGLDVAKPDDGLELPTFLKRVNAIQTVNSSSGVDSSLCGGGGGGGVSHSKVREPSKPAPDKSGTYDELKTSGALRSEPVAKPVGKPPVIRKTAKAKTAAPAAKRASKAPTKRAGPSGGQTKTALIGALLSREGGCTTADILKATGWKAVNVPREGGKCGLKLKQKKDGGVTRYWAA